MLRGKLGKTAHVGSLCGLLVLLAGCHTVAPVRTLPQWVRGIHIPVFENHTYEPGIEAPATRSAQEAFLVDGRVDVVPRRDADLVLQADIVDWEREASVTTDDKVATADAVTVVARLRLYDPFNLDEPLVDLGELTVRYRALTDTRSSLYLPEPDRREEIYELLAQQIVNRTLTGFPTRPGVKTVQPGEALPSIEDIRAMTYDDAGIAGE